MNNISVDPSHVRAGGDYSVGQTVTVEELRAVDGLRAVGIEHRPHRRHNLPHLFDLTAHRHTMR